MKPVPLNERVGYETVFDDDAMTVLRIQGREDQCIVSFTGAGHALGGIDLQTPEFTRSDSDATKFFVIDKQRSWGNNIDWKQLDTLLRDLAPGSQLSTLGNSMGGFLAILAAPRLKARQAIAFVPQWSIDPAIVPEEDRWWKYRSKVQDIRFSDLSEAVHFPTKFYVFFGSGPRDSVQLRHFIQIENDIELFILEECGHNAAAYLKAKGILYSLITACLHGEDIKTLLRRAAISVADVSAKPLAPS